jgi:hypothetical protein
MRQILLYQILLLSAVSLLSLSGCDLFGDEDKCQYETTESKIWSPTRDVAYSPRDSSVTFCFNRSGVLYERSFQINNVCPFGAVAVKINIKEKGSFLPPQPLRYRALLVERFPDSDIYKIRKIFNIYRQNETDLKGETVLELLGLPEDGPNYYFVGVAAIFEQGSFPDLLGLEAWATEHISQVEFIASFVKYE